MPSHTDSADHSYHEFEAEITMLSTKSLGLSKSCFNPPSDGQPADSGFIEDIYVHDVRLGCDDSLHHSHTDLDRVAKLSIGDSVRCRVDWRRKYRNLRLHTARHLVELAMRRTHVCGRSLRPSSGPDFASLDIEVDLEASPLNLDAVHLWVTTAVEDNLVITPLESVDGRTTRYWRLEGLGQIASTGQFLESTTEVGGLLISATVQRSRVELKIDLRRGESDVKILPCSTASKSGL